MATEAQINQVKRKIGEVLVSGGISYTRDAVSDIPRIEKTQEFIKNALSNYGMSIVFLDGKYYTTSWDNWQKVIEVMNPIFQKIPWKSESGDCDNRAILCSALIAFMFDLTMCSPDYCDVYNAHTGQHVDWHYNNLIIDDAGNVYLWDLDNNCMVQKITSNTPVMGNWKYNLSGIRPF